MPSLTALDAKNRFGQLIEMAQRSPVTITRNGRPSVVLSAADYERRQTNAGKRLLAAMNHTTGEAAEKGLTEQDLEKLLRDEQ